MQLCNELIKATPTSKDGMTRRGDVIVLVLWSYGMTRRGRCGSLRRRFYFWFSLSKRNPFFRFIGSSISTFISDSATSYNKYDEDRSHSLEKSGCLRKNLDL